MKIDIKILTPEFYERHPLPEHATPGSAAVDLRYAGYSSLTLWPGTRALIPTGLCVQLHPGTAMLLLPRSGLAHKHGITLSNAPGLVDCDYREEVQVSLLNVGEEAFTVEPGTRVAQAMVVDYHSIEFNAVEQLTVSERTSGFGSTGLE